MDEYHGILLPTMSPPPEHHEGSRNAQPAEEHQAFTSLFTTIRAAATILRLAPTISSAWLPGPGLGRKHIIYLSVCFEARGTPMLQMEN